MSIQSSIKSLQDAQSLFPYRPIRTTRAARRRLFLTARAEKERTDEGSATNILCGKGLIHAALDRWVLGERIFGERQIRHLADLDPPPPEIWELRVIEPRPQARLFGRFAEPDTLVLTAFHTRDLLGGKGSKAWRDAMEDCMKQWGSFVPVLPVFSGATIHEYVTENCDDFPIKTYLSGGRGLSKARPRRLRRRQIS